MSSPFLPITTPGRAVWIVTRAVLAGRSIRIFEMPACASFFFRSSRTLRSAPRYLGVFALVGEPLRSPVLGDSKADTGGMNFMTHTYRPVLLSPTTTVMWLVRLMMREPRPLARACMRFSAGPSSTMIVATFNSSTSAPRLFSALATADSSTFLIRCAAFLSLNSAGSSPARPAGRGPGRRPVAPSAARCARRAEWLWLPS